MDNPRLPYLSDKAHGLPLLPGVYIMKNKAGDIIYIGKAKALKNRVSSYFRSVEKHLPKVYRMVSQVFDFDYIVTDSEFEALVLECSMIKLHTPKYNILLKDDKGYSYIKIFPKEYSRIRQTFQREEDGAEYIGPYLSAYVVKETIDGTVERYLVDKEVHDHWNLTGLRDYFLGWLTVEQDLRFTTEQLAEVTDQQVKDMLNERAMKIYEAREKMFTPEIMREVERVVLLRVVDTKWMQHIDDMEELKRGMYLRSYAQKDPVVEYRIEGFDMFDAMIESIREDTVRLMFTIQLRTNEEPKREQVAKPAAESGSDGSIPNQPAKREPGKVGRNDPCPCGSGKKYKKCCGRQS